MSINIKDVQQPSASTATTDAGKGRKARTAVSTNMATNNAAGNAQSVSDSVSLTQTGLQLAQMEKQLAQQPSVNSQRVNQIRQAIKSGQYSIDSTRVANKLLGLEFSTKKPG